MSRESTFDFGFDDIVEQDGCLWIKILPEDNWALSRFCCFCVIPSGIRIIVAHAAPEETYRDHDAVTIPQRIWLLALPWLEKHAHEVWNGSPS